MVHAIIFTTLHFLRDLHMGPIRQSVCPLQVSQAQYNETLQFIRPICKLQRKLRVVNQSLCFILNLQMGPISQSVCPLQVSLAQYNETLQLIRPICKLQRKPHAVPGVLLTTTSFTSYLTNGTNKLECLSLASLTSIV